MGQGGVKLYFAKGREALLRCWHGECFCVRPDWQLARLIGCLGPVLIPNSTN